MSSLTAAAANAVHTQDTNGRKEERSLKEENTQVRLTIFIYKLMMIKIRYFNNRSVKYIFFKFILFQFFPKFSNFGACKWLKDSPSTKVFQLIEI